MQKWLLIALDEPTCLALSHLLVDYMRQFAGTHDPWEEGEFLTAAKLFMDLAHEAPQTPELAAAVNAMIDRLIETNSGLRGFRRGSHRLSWPSASEWIAQQSRDGKLVAVDPPGDS